MSRPNQVDGEHVFYYYDVLIEIHLHNRMTIIKF